MDRIIVEGVRCFYDRQDVPIKPITLLVGENSSGKTTFLALTRIAWDVFQGQDVDFNEEPFLLGAYDQIATYRAGKAGYARDFVIGGQRNINSLYMMSSQQKVSGVVTVAGRFTREEDQPHLKEWIEEGVIHGAGPFRVKISFQKGKRDLLTVTAPSGTATVEAPVSGVVSPHVRDRLMFLLALLSEASRRTDFFDVVDGTMLSDSDLGTLSSLMTFSEYPFVSGPRPYAFAPIRTQPKRTYDPVKEIPRPEGSHVPIVLAQTSLSNLEDWRRLKGALNAFGRESGLFSDVEIRRMGHKGSDPFQIKVKLSGPAFNLVDVGYGVSQVLPIVVDSLRAERGSTLLLQQPEVHLHPKAQAELGSFLATLAKQDNKQFLIETHSDYLMDRIRMEVRDGKILSADDVSILYFERENGSVRIHVLELDPYGNIVNQPSGYRQFFLEEEKRILGI